MNPIITRYKTIFSRQDNRYVLFLCSLMFVVGFIYINLHRSVDKSLDYETGRYELVGIDAKYIAHINAILENDKGIKDSMQSTALPVSTQSIQRIINYIAFNYPNWLAKNQLQVREGMVGLSKNGLISYLNSIQLHIQSYFWLNGPRTYLEIYFWSIFGVLASLLYYITEAIRNQDPNIKFEPSHVPSHVAKIVYSPLISLMIIFAFNATTDHGVDLSVSKLTIVVSFLLGFYSGRAMELLNRIKEVLLPFTTDKSVTTQGNAIPIATKQVTLDLALSNTELPPEVDYEEVLNQLGTAEVKLIHNDSKQETTLHKTGEDQDGLFTGEVSAGVYAVAVSLHTENNMHFKYEGEIDTTTADTFVIALVKDDVDG